MKKMLKVILIIVVVMVAGFGALLAAINERNINYFKYAETGGNLESKYTALGEYEVSYKEYDANNETIGKYAVWYPDDLKNSDNKYPVVVFANGTGSTSSTYKGFLKHLSSWGFIAVGNDDKDTRTGASLNKTIEFLIQENENEDSIFYQKIDLDNIGISGQSQGGPAVFNMVTNQKHGNMIKALYAASATSSYHTAVYGDGWEYDISKVNIPVFLAAGTGNWDSGTAASKNQVNDDEKGIAQGICPLWSLEENFNLIPENINKVIARKKNVNHGDSHLQLDGYMTAWFMYWLQNDKNAEKVFLGDNAEILTNKNWQDVKKNF
ncbi:MAG: chlorophyllase/cutinase-like alpha/beta fold protein [Lachnospiraceae bacterium]|jgi:hypothetical protein